MELSLIGNILIPHIIWKNEFKLMLIWPTHNIKCYPLLIYVWRKLSCKNHKFIKIIVFGNHDDVTCLKKIKFLCNFDLSYPVIVGQLFILIVVTQQVKWNYNGKYRLEIKKLFFIKTNFDSIVSKYIPYLFKLNMSTTV